MRANATNELIPVEIPKTGGKGADIAVLGGMSVLSAAAYLSLRKRKRLFGEEG